MRAVDLGRPKLTFQGAKAVRERRSRICGSKNIGRMYTESYREIQNGNPAVNYEESRESRSGELTIWRSPPSDTGVSEAGALSQQQALPCSNHLRSRRSFNGLSRAQTGSGTL